MRLHLLLAALVASGCAPGSDDGSDAKPLTGCHDPDNWSIEGDGRVCAGSCDNQAVVCSDGYDPPKCVVTHTDRGDQDCDIPDGKGEDLCVTALLTTCADLIK